MGDRYNVLGYSPGAYLSVRVNYYDKILGIKDVRNLELQATPFQ